MGRNGPFRPIRTPESIGKTVCVNREDISRATKGYQKVRELLCSWVQVKKEKHLTLTRGIRVSYLGFGTA